MRRRAAAGRGGEQGRVAERVRALLADPFGSPALDELPAGFDGGRASGDVDPRDDAAAEASGDVPLARRGGRRIRLDPGRRGAAMVGVAAIVAAVVTGVWVFSARPHAVPISGSGVQPAVPVTSASAPVGAVATASGGSAVRPSPTVSVSVAGLVVDVAGKVRRAGLYTLPAGSRIDDAVQAAGGALPGVSLTNLNLAAKLVDGQQILVGLPAASGAAAGDAPSSGTAGAASGPVNLNSAGLAQLETLPGIGPALGQRILDWRAAHGSFTTVSQLNEVSGIGDVRMAQLRPLVTI